MIPFSNQRIDSDAFTEARQANVKRWPTGAEVDLEEAIDYHLRLPRHKRLSYVSREASKRGRTLLQPRGGVAGVAEHSELLIHLQERGDADILPTTTDSYTRNEQFDRAQAGLAESARRGRSMLNGFPIVNHGVCSTRTVIDAIDRPAILLNSTALPTLIAEIALASGFTGFLGSALANTTSYTKDVTLEQGIRNYQYVDRLTALYAEHGVEIQRRQPGFLTGTMVPPSIAISLAVLDTLLAVSQGVEHYSPELAQCACPFQDIAALKVLPQLCLEYVDRLGLARPFLPITSLHWMGAWPDDEAQAWAVIAVGSFTAALGSAVHLITKTTHEAIGIPTKQANAAGLRASRKAIELAGTLRLTDNPEVNAEAVRIKREVNAIVDKVLEMGDGDPAVGSVRAFAAGVLDVPWSPNRHVAGRVMPACDIDGAIRLLDPGNVPIPPDIQEYHQERLALRAEKEHRPLDVNLAIDDVYRLQSVDSGMVQEMLDPP